MPLRPSSDFPVANGIHGFRSVLVNFYFVKSRGSPSWLLVDAGMPGCAPRLLREAVKRFGTHPPAAILLTHGHFDHVGALATLMMQWPHTPVYAHPAELPFVNEGAAYPAADPTVGGGLMALSSPLFPKHVQKLPRNVAELPENGEVPFASEWKWIATPGHSPGHVSLWRENDRVLLAGDAVVNTRQESAWWVLRQKCEIRPPPAYFTPDWLTAFESLYRVRALAPDVLASGHGVPAHGKALYRGIETLVAEFWTRGLPRHGRYLPRSMAPA